MINNVNKKLNTIIIGASGYTGVELVKILSSHPTFDLQALYVSSNSLDANKALSELYPELQQRINLPLTPLTNKHQELVKLATTIDVVFLATDHKVSHDLVPLFLAHGCVVLDLSAAFRLQNADLYPQHYGFTHQTPELLASAVYGLAEWNYAQIKTTNLIAVPGCYPTVSLLALKPLVAEKLLVPSYLPIINAISGVSGAGRKANLNLTFCELSLQPYGVFNHRHQPEIASHLQQEVIFTPHLANLKRGILATIVAQLKPGVTSEQVAQAYSKYYASQPLIRLYTGTKVPMIRAVENSPYCDLAFAVKNEYITIMGAEDNLLKGAAAQAVQCANLRFDLPQTLGLV